MNPFAGPLGKLRLLRAYLRVFPSTTDAKLFRRLLREPKRFAEGHIAELHVKALGDVPMHCRAHTTDAHVFWDVFFKQYHLPLHPLKDARCIVDLGANTGYTTAHFAALHPNARVVAVELDPANADIAARNIAGFGSRCTLVRGAVWSEDGSVNFGGTEAWGLSVSADGPATARAISVGTLFRENNITAVDYLKMDIEGAEGAVFDADLGWLSAVRQLQVEFHTDADAPIIMSRLTAAGFRTTIDPRHPRSIAAVRV